MGVSGQARPGREKGSQTEAGESDFMTSSQWYGDVRGWGGGGGVVIICSVGPSAFRFIFCISIMAGGVCILLCQYVIHKPVVPPLPDFTQHPSATPRLHTAPFRPLPYIYCRLRYYHINQLLHGRLLRSPPLLSQGIQSSEFKVVSTIVWILIPTLPCSFIDVVFTAGSGTTLRFPSQRTYQSSSCLRHYRSTSRRKRG
jgi:hypothetical protein